MNFTLAEIPFFQDNQAGILASLISMICFGFADSLWKIPAQVFGASRTIFFRNVFVLLIVLPYFLISEKKFYLSSDVIMTTIGISILGYLGLYSFAKATKAGLTSVVVPVAACNTLVTLLLHIVSLEKAINPAAAASLVLTLAGLALLKFNWRNGRFDLAVLKESGFRYALLAALFWGLSFGYSWFAVTFVGPPLFSLIQESIILLLAGLHTIFLQWYHPHGGNPFRQRMGMFEVQPQKDIDPNPGTGVRYRFSLLWKQNLIYLALIGILGSLGSIFNTIALDKASINTVAGIVVVAPLISVFFGQIYYGERLTLQQKIAVFLIIAGVYGISYFRYYTF